MPVLYRFVEDHGLLIVSHIGEVTRDEFLRVHEEAFADPRYARCTRELVDRRAETHSEHTTDDQRYMDHLTRSRLEGREEGLRTAILAPQDYAYGMGRIYTVLAEGSREQVSVVRTLAEAAEWLGIDLAVLAGIDIMNMPGGA